MDTIKLTLELTPAQLSRLMLDIRTGADVPREPKPASHAWLEEKLAEAEEMLIKQGNTVANQSVEISRLKLQISQQAENMDAYKTQLKHTEQELADWVVMVVRLMETPNE